MTLPLKRPRHSWASHRLCLFEYTCQWNKTLTASLHYFLNFQNSDYWLLDHRGCDAYSGKGSRYVCSRMLFMWFCAHSGLKDHRLLGLLLTLFNFSNWNVSTRESKDHRNCKRNTHMHIFKQLPNEPIPWLLNLLNKSWTMQGVRAWRK